MAATKVIFSFDPVSPWARFGYVLLKRYQKIWNLNIELRPVFLGGVMQGSGNSPPISVVNKGLYMGQDMKLAGDYFGIKYKYPTTFPVNTINCVRVLRVIIDRHVDSLPAAADLFFEAIWGPQADANVAITIPGIVTILKNLFDEATIKSLLEAAASTENKDRIKADAAELVKAGCFGFPWIVVERADGQRANFFGSDRFELMAFFLQKPYLGPHPESKSNL